MKSKISLEDFKTFESLKQDLNVFVVEKCIEQEQAARGDDVETYFYDEYKDFRLQTDVIVVRFLYHGRADNYKKYLPLNIVFDPDFKYKMKKEFDDAKEKAKRQLEEIEREKVEREKQFEMSRLKELMAKYPEIAKEGV